MQGRRSWLADRALFDTLRDRLGLSRVKSAATGGSALGPDTFRFFLAMGVPLRQLYGQTEAAGAYTIQTGGELDFDSSGLPVRRHRDPDPRARRDRARRDPGPSLGHVQGLFQAARGDRARR